ncbi:MAG: ABC transporter ATP-binding protein [Thermoanaerobaculia bacterium]
MSDSALLATRALAWTAGGREILAPLDLTLEGGECLAVIGPNGAGKTTLLRLVVGVLKPSTGDVLWRGRPLAAPHRLERARRIAYVPQIRPARVPLTARDVVLLGRYPHRSRWRLGPTADDFRAVDRSLERVEMAHLAARPVDELSGGERQGVYIAAALAQEAELLALDEPTTHLDPHHQLRIARLLGDLVAEGRHTILFTTHDLNLAAAVAGRVVALVQGRVAAAGPPGEVLEPEVLGRVFRAPFAVQRDGDRPHVHLEYGR